MPFCLFHVKHSFFVSCETAKEQTFRPALSLDVGCERERYGWMGVGEFMCGLCGSIVFVLSFSESGCGIQYNRPFPAALRQPQCPRGASCQSRG